MDASAMEHAVAKAAASAVVTRIKCQMARPAILLISHSCRNNIAIINKILFKKFSMYCDL
jgi:hypothetical protein